MAIGWGTFFATVLHIHSPPAGTRRECPTAISPASPCHHRRRSAARSGDRAPGEQPPARRVFFLSLLSSMKLRPLLALLLVGCRSEASTNAGSCIAPANPGGGCDCPCRTAAQMLGPLTPGGRPLRVTNIPGDGGGVAFTRVVAESRGNERVIAAASPSTLLGLAPHPS